MQQGFRVPGNGCLAAAIECTLRNAGGDGLICEKIMTGKPNKAIIDLIRNQHSIPEEDLPKMLMIGDRPNTDIALGNNAGIDSCLVLTGVVQNEEEALRWAMQDPANRPTFIVKSFGESI